MGFLSLIQTGEMFVDRSLRNLVEQLDKLVSCPILSGRQIDNVTTVVGTVTVNHGLDRVPQGYFVVEARTAAPSLFMTASDEKTITFTSGTAGTISLIVY